MFTKITTPHNPGRIIATAICDWLHIMDPRTLSSKTKKVDSWNLCTADLGVFKSRNHEPAQFKYFLHLDVFSVKDLNV